jgi:hypothetical protein
MMGLWGKLALSDLRALSVTLAPLAPLALRVILAQLGLPVILALLDPPVLLAPPETLAHRVLRA